MDRKLRIRIGLPLVIVLGQLAIVGGADAFPYQRGIVSADPADFTPHVLGGNVNTFALVGRTMYAGGVIHAVQAEGSATVLTRTNLMAFDAVTGAVLPFAPVVNGQVWSLLPADDGTLLVAGSFTAIDGVAVRGLAKIDLATNQLVPAFDARLNGAATDVQLVNGQLVVAGKFTTAGGAARTYLASLDPRTGTATPYLALGIGGRVSDLTGGTHVYRFSVDPAGSRLVMMGNFTSVAGQRRSRVAMLDLGAARATLAVFDDIRFYEPCDITMPAYFRDADWSSDGSYFVLVSTGLVAAGSLCDSASRWDDFTHNSGPTWINKTGGDTLHSVAVTGSAVYVGGHQRWLDNPYGRNSPGRGAVSRPGVAAIDPTTGRALAWNPTRARGIGAKELYPTYVDGIRGLWIGSDTEMLGGERHGSIGFFPVA